MTAGKQRIFRLILRLVGSSALLAVFAVVMPSACMNLIHQWLGMGELPDAPIVGYLARSTSAFYALLGGLFWVVSFDLPRYRALLTYLGAAVFLLGIALLAIDVLEGLPLWWTLAEGPFGITFGIVILVFCRQLEE